MISAAIIPAPMNALGPICESLMCVRLITVRRISIGKKYAFCLNNACGINNLACTMLRSLRFKFLNYFFIHVDFVCFFYCYSGVAPTFSFA